MSTLNSNDPRLKSGGSLERMGLHIGDLEDALSAALDEHDGQHGVFADDFMPNHWTHKARRLLKE